METDPKRLVRWELRVPRATPGENGKEPRRKSRGRTEIGECPSQSRAHYRPGTAPSRLESGGPGPSTQRRSCEDGVGGAASERDHPSYDMDRATPIDGHGKKRTSAPAQMERELEINTDSGRYSSLTPFLPEVMPSKLRYRSRDYRLI